MESLQLVALEQNDITTWDFEQIRENLESVLSVYQNTVYTDETIKAAKSDKATLAKAKKLIDDRRKAYKEQCLEPYMEIEPRVKELTAMIEERRQMIDSVVKDYTDRQKQNKEKEVRAYYDRKAFPLGGMSAKLFERILDPKWLNASMKKSQYEEEVQSAINQAAEDIQSIQQMNSPFIETLLETYSETLSMDVVRQKNDELKTVHEKAGFQGQAPDKTGSFPEVKPTETIPVANSENGVLLRIYASSHQLTQIMDFMKAIGAHFEVQ